jgi:hypothetical protein
MVHGLQSNNFTNQAQLFTVAKNAHVVGKQTVDGVSTTEYAGSFTAAEGLKALPASFRQALAPGLQALGDSTVYFHEWIDGQHHPRKVTEIEILNGDTISTTINITAINQPVSIMLPPASQTSTPAALRDLYIVFADSGWFGRGAGGVCASGTRPIWRCAGGWW